MHFILAFLLILYAVGVIASTNDIMEIYRKIMGFVFLSIIGFFALIYFANI